MAEIPVEKKSNLTWLWVLLGLLLLGLLLWWLLSDDDDEVVEPAPVAAEAQAEPITDINALLVPNAATLAGREVRLQGVEVQNAGDGQALLVGPGGENAVLVVPQGATMPEGIAAGRMVNVAGTVRTNDALGANRPALANDGAGDIFIAASSITMADAEAAVADPAAPPTPETVAAANRQALQRLRADPNATPRVYFPWDSAEVTSEAQQVLDAMIETRADARTAGITLVGFADRSGPRPYNRELSEQRAEAVRRYLAGKGIGADMIDVEAEGETPTLVETGNDEREPLNRRVRIELADG